MLGIAEAGDLRLNSARSEPLEWDSRSFRRQALSDLKPHILASLDALSNEKNVPSRFRFLAEVGRMYGNELLRETALRWITIVEPPGDARLISATELASIISKESEILIGFGLDPWSGYKECHAAYPAASYSAPVVLVTKEGQPEVGSWNDKEGYTVGSLAEHFSVRHGYPVDPSEIHLLLPVIDTIAATWNIAVQTLVDSNWIRRKTEWVCGHLSRE